MTKKITITDLADAVIDAHGIDPGGICGVGGWEKTPTIPLEEA